MSKLVVFLGNPGTQYQYTRHNIAWLVSDRLEDELPLAWKEKFNAKIANLQGNYMIKPLSYMNKSGESVGKARSYFGIDINDMLVVHDDIERSFGTVELKRGGGLGGHNGLKSIVQKTSEKDFYRLRIGISRPRRQDVSSYVLGKFSPEERAELDSILKGAVLEVKRFIEV